MKKGQDIKEMLNNINEDTKNKRDYLVDLKGMKVNVNDYDSVYPTIEVDHLSQGEYVLNDS